jgi:hypothetical protein
MFISVLSNRCHPSAPPPSSWGLRSYSDPRTICSSSNISNISHSFHTTCSHKGIQVRLCDANVPPNLCIGDPLLEYEATHEADAGAELFSNGVNGE